MAHPVLAPQNTWYKGSAPRNEITYINFTYIPPVLDWDEEWNADVDNSGSIKGYRCGTEVYIWPLDGGEMACNPDSSYMFSDITGTSAEDTYFFENVTNIDGLDILITDNVTTMQAMFRGCTSLEHLDIRGFNTSNVTSMRFMFGVPVAFNKPMQLRTIKGLANFDTSNVTDFYGIFLCCTNLTDLSSISAWDTSKVTDMSGMFSNCSSLTSLDLSQWNTNSVTSLQQIFGGTNPYGAMSLSSIKGLENWNVSHVRNFAQVFQGCQALTSLNIGNWDTSAATNMMIMFGDCRSLTELNLSNWDVSHVTAMDQMFYGCYNLQTLDISTWNTLNNKSTFGTFAYCYSLTKLDFTNWDMAKVNHLDGMLVGCRALSEISIGEKFKFFYNEDYDGDGFYDSEQEVYLPQPNPEYIPGATGVWYKSTGEQYNGYPIDPGIYYAVPQGVLINYQTLFELANIVRDSKLTDEKLSIDEISQGLAELTPANLSFELRDGSTISNATITSIELTEGIVNKIVVGDNIIYKNPINLINTAGYTDGVFLDGSGSELIEYSGYTTTGMIEIPQGYQVTFSGLNLDHTLYTFTYINMFREDGSHISSYYWDTSFAAGFTFVMDENNNFTIQAHIGSYKTRISSYSAGKDIIATISKMQ